MNQNYLHMGAEIIILFVFICVTNIVRYLRGKSIYKNVRMFFDEATCVEIELLILLTTGCAYFIFFHAQAYEGFAHWYLRVSISSTLLAIALGLLNLYRIVRPSKKTIGMTIILWSMLVIVCMILGWSVQIGYNYGNILWAIISLYGSWCIMLFLAATSFFAAEEKAYKWKTWFK